MGKGFFIQTKDFEESLKKFNALPKDFERDVETLVKASAVVAESYAIGTSPIDNGFLRKSHYLERNKNFTKSVVYKVGNSAIYAPFNEFGTVKKVEIPPGLENFAKQFETKDRKIFEGGMNPNPWMVKAVERGYLELQIFMNRTVLKYYGIKLK